MDCCRERSIPWIIFSKALGLLVFLFFLYLANIAQFFIGSPLVYLIMFFLNENVWFLILMSIVFMFGEIFNALRFPFSLPAPLFNAVGSVFLVFFLLMVSELAGILTGIGSFEALKSIAFLLYHLIFAIVLICGYIWIFAGMVCCREGTEEGERRHWHHGKKRTWPEMKEELMAAKDKAVNAIDRSLARIRKETVKGNSRKKKKK